ncbi:MAG: DUF3800 domain-containing protein [Lachnospiraceae bacterium]|nr:DUF3800 domain-containing protein [Lachnospiraceae bacterium]
MNQYTLFLDESYTYKKNGQEPAFAVGGFIVNNSDISKINAGIDSLKREIWHDLPTPTDVILHELDLKDALNDRVPRTKLKTHYHKFRDDKNLSTTVYRRVSKIIKTENINTVGCVVIKNRYFNNFPQKMSHNSIYSNTRDLLNNILLKSYDGTTNNKDRYGIKTVPRISNGN